MPLTRIFRETIFKRVRSDSVFRTALVEEAVQNIFDGNVEVGLDQLLDVEIATIGFHPLSASSMHPTK